MFIFRDFVHYHGVVEKSRLVYSSVYNRCDGNGKFSCMRDRGVKETMSQWIFISLIGTNEGVVYSRF
jgi:hypothetical protein